jgi:enolase
MVKILEVEPRLIYNSRKEETIEIRIKTKDGVFITSAPSGASKGKYEKQAFASSVKGKEVRASIASVSALGEKLVFNGYDFNNFDDLILIEDMIEKINSKAKKEMFGANPMFALESSILKAISKSYGFELWQYLCKKPKILPMPLGNCIGGGKHIITDKKTDFQEFLFLPRVKKFFDAQFINLNAYQTAKSLVHQNDKEYTGLLTDENALAVSLDNESVLKLLEEVRQRIIGEFGIDFGIGIDCAASSFYKNKFYYYHNLEKKRSKEEQIEFILDLIKKYNISYMEDPLDEEDFSGFNFLLKEVKRKGINCMICGDDLTVTNFSRVERAVKNKCVNAIIVKPNQQGSLVELRKIIEFAKKNDITPVISHRSGETADDTIADLAVGFQCPIIKTGILGKERFAKLNRINKIERGI